MPQQICHCQHVDRQNTFGHFNVTNLIETHINTNGCKFWTWAHFLWGSSVYYWATIRPQQEPGMINSLSQMSHFFSWDFSPTVLMKSTRLLLHSYKALQVYDIYEALPSFSIFRLIKKCVLMLISKWTMFYSFSFCFELNYQVKWIKDYTFQLD